MAPSAYTSFDHDTSQNGVNYFNSYAKASSHFSSTTRHKTTTTLPSPLSSNVAYQSTVSPSSTSPPLHAVITSASFWTYLSEGASNVLYRYTGPPSPVFSNYLLRLRKSLPGSPDTLTHYTALQTYFLPVLGEDVIVPTVLARLADGVAGEFNAALRSGIGMLRRKCAGGGGGGVGIGRGDIDEKEIWGMLVRDMSCGMAASASAGRTETREWRDVAMIEFKPRWLAQSTDAPEDWNVCRSCAVRRMQGGGGLEVDIPHTRKSLRPKKRKPQHHRRCLSGDSGIGMISDDEEDCSDGDDEELDHSDPPPTYCPLDLSSQNPHRVHRAATALLTTPAGTLHWAPYSPADYHLQTMTSPLLIPHLAHWLSPGSPGGEILLRLRNAQEYWGRHGVFCEGGGEVEEVGKAMALRDCSVWVRVWVSTEGGEMQIRFECRVGDLDVKPGKGAGGVYWRNMERRLCRGRWYGVWGEEEEGCRE